VVTSVWRTKLSSLSLPMRTKSPWPLKRRSNQCGDSRKQIQKYRHPTVS
jgi:hypothetical protein